MTNGERGGGGDDSREKGTVKDRKKDVCEVNK